MELCFWNPQTKMYDYLTKQALVIGVTIKVYPAH